MTASLNSHGDSPKFVANGHGADIASQRADDLDLMALAYVKERSQAGVQTFAVDVGCGEGGQSIRLAQEGARVLAVDLIDGRAVLGKAGALSLGNKVDFLRCDMRDLRVSNVKNAHLISCQRAIHYLDFSEALCVVAHLRHMLVPSGRLYISASGMASELGDGYAGRHRALEVRHAELAQPMREKHGIHAPVCLYTEADFRHLLRLAGFASVNVFSSPFGNVKAVAS